MKNYGIPPIIGISNLLTIETRNLPNGAARVCQLTNQSPTWFTHFKNNVVDYQNLEVNNSTQGSWKLHQKSVVVDINQTESAPVNTFAKTVLSNPSRNIHQYKDVDSWRILFGSSFVGNADPNTVQTPDFIGQIYIDSTNSNIYISNGLTNTDWFLAGAGGGS